MQKLIKIVGPLENVWVTDGSGIKPKTFKLNIIPAEWTIIKKQKKQKVEPDEYNKLLPVNFKPTNNLQEQISMVGVTGLCPATYLCEFCKNSRYVKIKIFNISFSATLLKKKKSSERQEAGKQPIVLENGINCNCDFYRKYCLLSIYSKFTTMLIIYYQLKYGIYIWIGLMTPILGLKFIMDSRLSKFHARKLRCKTGQKILFSLSDYKVWF